MLFFYSFKIFFSNFLTILLASSIIINRRSKLINRDAAHQNRLRITKLQHKLDNGLLGGRNGTPIKGDQSTNIFINQINQNNINEKNNAIQNLTTNFNNQEKEEGVEEKNNLNNNFLNAFNNNNGNLRKSDVSAATKSDGNNFSTKNLSNSNTANPNNISNHSKLQTDNFSNKTVNIERLKKTIHAFKNLYYKIEILSNYYTRLVSSNKNNTASTASLNSNSSSSFKFNKKKAKIEREKIYLEKLLNSNIYSVKDIHSLENYQKILLVYLIESVNSGSPEFAAEAILEYIQFLLNYRLKLSNYCSLFDSVEIYEENEKREIERKKDKNSFDEFDELFNGLNDYKNYRKNYSKENREKNSNPTSNFNMNINKFNAMSFGGGLGGIFGQGNSQLSFTNLKICENLIKFIAELFSEFDTVYTKLKNNNINQDFYKKILEEIKISKQDTNFIIEPPFVILKQKSYYLKGLFAMYCGNYVKALEFFSHSRKTKIICDAGIIKKSSIQIKKIINFLKIRLKEELIITQDLYSNASSNMPTQRNNNMNHTNGFNNMNNHLMNNNFGVNNFFGGGNTGGNNYYNEIKSLKNQIEKLNANIDISEVFLNDLEKEVEIFNSSKPKDIVVLVDVNENMRIEAKKIERSIKTSKIIYMDLLSQEDRFGLFTFSSNLQSCVKLNYKSNVDFNLISLEYDSLIYNILAQWNSSGVGRKLGYHDDEKGGHSGYFGGDSTVNNELNRDHNANPDTKLVKLVSDDCGENGYLNLNKNSSSQSTIGNRRQIRFGNLTNNKKQDNNNNNQSNNQSTTPRSNNNKALGGVSPTNRSTEKYSFKMSIYNTYCYLKKVSNPEREKWVIIFTDDHQKKKNDANIFNIFNKKFNVNDTYHIIIVGYNLSEENFGLFSEKLKEISDYSMMLDSEHSSLISELIRGSGDVCYLKNFRNEVYEADEN